MYTGSINVHQRNSEVCKATSLQDNTRKRAVILIVKFEFYPAVLIDFCDKPKIKSKRNMKCLFGFGRPCRVVVFTEKVKEIRQNFSASPEPLLCFVNKIFCLFVYALWLKGPHQPFFFLVKAQPLSGNLSVLVERKQSVIQRWPKSREYEGTFILSCPNVVNCQFGDPC